ncbi:trehalose synthase : Trehalose synthase OS=Chloroflexus aggregans (strain MD-66 / DSM 9485) GN=Cagg_2090 PE=4 SV=1: Alpha-amylase [Gemmataceae bacterium]|nr:trehalose synthase : Trehalose synthase OS=Chloroflexus aggregans (strain MD-66 / DSM 9485) GN=Cagg_2090 PE=4 SV=1: Alpha-amylase [Gemmataceae bacterium]VTT97828.1 trehalose synthase : Trehalose synthase OS=Chloroflexus aggregans (strain MD-66 / DSM 9485) GN=Cagg_2090 PE=4 SV=1: Alpha-amylase [Gemmataceae bacterium]
MTDTDPLWYKDAVFYQIHVRAYQDSAGDGVGDFRGLRQRLDYIQDLGVTAIWLQPFYPSPLRDDGYDIADYTAVNPQYGTLKDFRDFLDAAHRRGLRVITELVINHTSDQHPWFQQARRAPKGSPERDLYVWSDAPDKYLDARIIFKDFERSNWTYDPVADQYYWHRFYSHQPDLNFDNPLVWDRLTPVLDQWLEMGVDGMRLDAIPYLFEREGTNCENLPETHAYLKRLRAHMDAKFPGRMFLAEANQWPEDAVHYFGDGDECNMAFHFPVMPRLYMALHQEDRFPIIDILEQTPPIPDNCQWCMFLRNHDELTLEMVTDEERDYMYRAYASDSQARINLGIRRRLAPLLRNDRRRIELMNALLFSMPGTPVVYYGDEIGMGDNIYLGDRNGVRTPMQWSSDRNAGFSKANPQKLYLPAVVDPEYHYETVNVEAQQSNSSSLLWWMKRLIALRKQYRAFGRGAIAFLRPDNSKILAFVRRHEDETLLVVANLSRFVQYVRLDLAEFAGRVPVELFGRTAFPVIGADPVPFTLGPHGFYWFSIAPAPVQLEVAADRPREAPVPRLPVADSWEDALHPDQLDRLELALWRYLTDTVVHHGRTRAVRDVTVRAAARLPLATPTGLVLVDVNLLDGETQARAVRLGFAPPEGAAGVAPGAVVAELVRNRAPAGVLFDARTDPAYSAALLRGITANGSVPFDGGEVAAVAFPQLAGALGPDEVPEPIAHQRTRQHDLTVTYGTRLVLKTFERTEAGVHPALELGRFLTEHAGYDRTAPVLGAVELRPTDGPATTMAVLYGYVPHEGTAWQYTLDVLSRFYEGVLATPVQPPPPAGAGAWVSDAAPAGEGRDWLGPYLDTAAQLGRDTAALHRALASGTGPALAPEPFGKLYQRSVYQGMRTRIGMVFRELKRRLPDLSPAGRVLAAALLGTEGELTRRCRDVLRPEMTGQRVRVHGNYHLGEFLYTGAGFVVTDFEGDPERPLSERRIKRSPLRDVADMVRSFHYAALTPLFGPREARGNFAGVVRGEDRGELMGWARFWASWVSARFVRAYLEGIAGAGLVPSDPAACRDLLELMVLEKAVVELGSDLDFQPDRVAIPITGLLDIVGAAAVPPDAPAHTRSG